MFSPWQTSIMEDYTVVKRLGSGKYGEVNEVGAVEETAKKCKNRSPKLYFCLEGRAKKGACGKVFGSFGLVFREFAGEEEQLEEAIWKQVTLVTKNPFALHLEVELLSWNILASLNSLKHSPTTVCLTWFWSFVLMVTCVNIFLHRLNHLQGQKSTCIPSCGKSHQPWNSSCPPWSSFMRSRLHTGILSRTTCF